MREYDQSRLIKEWNSYTIEIQILLDNMYMLQSDILVCLEREYAIKTVDEYYQGEHKIWSLFLIHVHSSFWFKIQLTWLLIYLEGNIVNILMSYEFIHAQQLGSFLLSKMPDVFIQMN